MRVLLKYAVARKLLTAANMPTVGAKKIVLRRRPHFNSKQEDKLYQTLDQMIAEETRAIRKANLQLLRALTLIMINSGLRLGEAVNLRWFDVDLSNEEVYVRKGKLAQGLSPPMTWESSNSKNHRPQSL